MPTSTNNVIIGPDETATKVSQAGHLFNAEAFDNFVSAVDTPITAASGGFQFPNWPCAQLWIRNASGNGPMFVGGIGQNAVYSGRGMRLYGNEAMTVPIKNANRMTIMSTVSGQFIEFGVFLLADTSQITVDTSGIYSPPSDTTPPTLLSVTPVSGISGVEHDALISATFDEPIASSTIDTTSFTVRLSGAGQPLVSGIAFLNPSNNMNAIFSPYSGAISGSFIYVARLGTQITDEAGNALVASATWHWTTISTAPPPDTTLPRVSGTFNTSGDIDAGIANDKTITFSEALQSGSINSSKIFLQLSGTNVPATVTLDSDLVTVRINPSNNLDYVKKYTMNVLSGGARDLAGNYFSGTFQSNFTTKEPTWNTPYVVSLETSDHNLDNDRFRIGEKMTSSSPYPLSGKNIQKVRVYLKKVGSPLSGVSGASVLLLRNNDEVLGTFGKFNPASLTTSFAPYEFVNTDITSTMQNDRKIVVQWLSGTASNKIAVAITENSEFTGGQLTTYDGATYSGAIWTEENSDLVGTFYSTN